MSSLVCILGDLSWMDKTLMRKIKTNASPDHSNKAVWNSVSKKMRGWTWKAISMWLLGISSSISMKSETSLSIEVEINCNLWWKSTSLRTFQLVSIMKYGNELAMMVWRKVLNMKNASCLEDKFFSCLFSDSSSSFSLPPLKLDSFFSGSHHCWQQRHIVWENFN